MHIEPSYPAVPASGVTVAQGGHPPAVSWGAVCAGAALAAVFSVIALMLGGAGDVVAATPQSYGGSDISVPTIGWIALTLLVAFGIAVMALAAWEPNEPPAP